MLPLFIMATALLQIKHAWFCACLGQNEQVFLSPLILTCSFQGQPFFSPLSFFVSISSFWTTQSRLNCYSVQIWTRVPPIEYVWFIGCPINKKNLVGCCNQISRILIYSNVSVNCDWATSVSNSTLLVYFPWCVCNVSRLEQSFNVHRSQNVLTRLYFKYAITISY